jgi:hypothetical protein
LRSPQRREQAQAAPVPPLVYPRLMLRSQTSTWRQLLVVRPVLV